MWALATFAHCMLYAKQERQWASRRRFSYKRSYDQKTPLYAQWGHWHYIGFVNSTSRRSHHQMLPLARMLGKLLFFGTFKRLIDMYFKELIMHVFL